MNTATIPLRDYSLPRAKRSPYYFTPEPLITDRCSMPGATGGYLSADGNEISEGAFVRLRVQSAQDIEPRRIQHSGWFTDDDGSQTIYGIVATLPRSRGFLAGWTMGPQMITQLDRTNVHYDLESAAYDADDMARRAAEDEREYQESQRAEDEAEAQDIDTNEGGF